LKEVGEGVDGSWELIVAVPEDAKVPPTFLPIGLELFGLGVQLDCEGQVLLVPGGGGPGSEIVELGRGLLNRGRLLRSVQRTREGKRGNQGKEYELADDRDGEVGECHVLPGFRANSVM
jgi:hypothetical protein